MFEADEVSQQLCCSFDRGACRTWSKGLIAPACLVLYGMLAFTYTIFLPVQAVVAVVAVFATYAAFVHSLCSICTVERVILCFRNVVKMPVVRTFQVHSGHPVDPLNGSIRDEAGYLNAHTLAWGVSTTVGYHKSLGGHLRDNASCAHHVGFAYKA